MSRSGTRPVQTMAPAPEMPLRLDSHPALLRQIIELQDAILKLTRENARLRELTFEFAPGYLRCTRCLRWRPDETFPLDRTHRGQARRGRQSYCRECYSERRVERLSHG